MLIKTAARSIPIIANHLRQVGHLSLTDPCAVWKDYFTEPCYYTNPHVSELHAPLQYVSSIEPPVAPTATPIRQALARPRDQSTKRTELACSFSNDMTAYMHIATKATIKKEATKTKDVRANLLKMLETGGEDEEVLKCKFSVGSPCRS